MAIKGFFAFRRPSLKEFVINLLIFVVILVGIRLSVQALFPEADQSEIINSVRNAWLVTVIVIFVWRARQGKNPLKADIVPGILYLIIGAVLNGLFAGIGGDVAVVLGYPVIAFYLLVFYRPGNQQHKDVNSELSKAN